VWGEPLEICAAPFETEVPLVDPDHNFAGVTYEIFRKWNITKDDVPNMGGFVERQSEKYESTPGDAAFVIKAYDQKKTALLAELAQNFAFFDAYVRSDLKTMEEGTSRLKLDYSSPSTPAQPTPTANLQPRDRAVALLITLTRLLGFGTMSRALHAPHRSSNR
jgi:hypothetical protein